jgi:Gpi18-like mannosyltransferase
MPWLAATTSLTTTAASGATDIRDISFKPVGIPIGQVHKLSARGGNLVANPLFGVYEDGFVPALTKDESGNATNDLAFAASANGVPDSWSFYAGAKDNASYLLNRWNSLSTSSLSAIERRNYIEIKLEDTTAYISQKIVLKRNTDYIVSFDYWINYSGTSGATGLPATPSLTVTDDTYGNVGLHAAFLNDPYYTGNSVTHSIRSGQTTSYSSQPWVSYTAYVNSNDVTDTDFAIRIGSPRTSVTGTVRITNISVKEAELTDAQKNELHTLSTYSTDASSKIGGITLVIILSWVIVAIFIIAVWQFSTSRLGAKIKDGLLVNGAVPPADNGADGVPASAVPETKADVPAPASAASAVLPTAGTPVPKVKRFFTNRWTILSLCVAVGFLLRLLVVSLVKGFRPDFNAYIDNVAILSAGGLNEFFSGGGSPGSTLYTYWLKLISGLTASMNTDSFGFNLMLKLPFILADLGSACVIYFITRKIRNGRFAFTAAIIMLLNPASFMISAAWGSDIVIVSFFILLTLAFLVNREFLGFYVSYALALAAGYQALIFLPVVLIYTIYVFARAIVNLIRGRNNPDGGTFLSKMKYGTVYSDIYRIPLALIFSLALYYVLTLPLSINYTGTAFLYPFYDMLVKPLLDVTVYSDNAFNVFGLIGSNGTVLTASTTMNVITAVGAALLLVINVLIFMIKRNRANLILLAALSVILTYTFMFGVTPVLYALLLPILLLSFVVVKDKRLLTVFAVYSVLLLINAGSVLANGIYLNYLPDWMLDTYNNVAYAGSPIITSAPLLIVFSALQLLAALYYVYVVLDVVISKKVRAVKLRENNGLFSSLKEFFASGKK